MRPSVRQSVAAGAVVAALAACASAPGTPAPSTAPRESRPPSVRTDTAPALVPAGFGTLRQDDIALRLQVDQVQVRAIPLEESVIRVLAPDSYRSLHGLRESRRESIERLAGRYMLRERNVWLVSFYGLAPEARFSPGELTLSVSGRDYRPVEILPLSAGFGEQRVAQRETQTALYLYGDGVDLAQPVIARMQGREDASWGDILQRVEQERALIRGRATRSGP